MSTALYPQGMRGAMPASGYNHKSTYYNKQYATWKGTGVLSNPVGIAPSHIRPLTNNDSGNVFLSGSFPSRTYPHTRVFLPRPIKHFRKGRVVPNIPITVTVPNPDDPDQYHEVELINYNMNRIVKSSTGQSLGGGFGGSGLLNEMMDKPGAYIVKQNVPKEINESNQSNIDCKTCEGVGVVASYYPNNTYVEENPIPQTQNPVWCCNEEYKALRRVIYANSYLKQNYFPTHSEYLKNRCQTYDQKVFNFAQPLQASRAAALAEAGITPAQIQQAKPGSPLALFNTYVANCYPNADVFDATENALIAKFLDILLKKGFITQEQIAQYTTTTEKYNFDTLVQYIGDFTESERLRALEELQIFINNPYWGVPFAGVSNPNGCKLTVYKPNNYQFAKQGAVSSSTRMLKLNVDTISTNAASINNYNNLGGQLVTANQLYAGDIIPNQLNLLKNKANTNCQNPPIFPFQNKKACSYRRNKRYSFMVSQPSPYRDYISTVFHTNHFTQSPRTYINNTNQAKPY